MLASSGVVIAATSHSQTLDVDLSSSHTCVTLVSREFTRSFCCEFSRSFDKRIIALRVDSTHKAIIFDLTCCSSLPKTEQVNAI
jgi:hypothetical protein